MCDLSVSYHDSPPPFFFFNQAKFKSKKGEIEEARKKRVKNFRDAMPGNCNSQNKSGERRSCIPYARCLIFVEENGLTLFIGADLSSRCRGAHM